MNLLKKVSVLVAAAAVAVCPLFAQTTWTRSQTGTHNGYDYELWSEDNRGSSSMTLTGDNGSGANAKGGTFTAQWSNTLNVLFRSGKKYSGTQGTSGQTHKQIGNISIDFDATWSSPDNVKMLGVYGWGFYASGSIPSRDENNTNRSFSNQIEYYIIQDRGSYNAATGGDTRSTVKGEATIDGILYEFRVCDRIGRHSLQGSSTNFKQYFSVPKSTSSHRSRGIISVSKHFEEWEKAGMKMDGPLYEVALKVESYSTSGASGTATVNKNILTVGGGVTTGNYTLTTGVSPTGAGTITPTPNPAGYASGTSVTLTASAASGWQFAGWTGDASGTGASTTVTMSRDRAVTATFTPTSSNTTNLVKSGNFPSGSIGSSGDWRLNSGADYGNSAATSSVSGGSAAINITTAGSQPYQPQLVQQGIELTQGQKYRLTFTASAASARSINVLIQRIGSGSDGWTTYAEDDFNLTSSAAEYTLDFTMTAASDPNAQLAFNLGGSGMSNTSVTIRDVKLNYGGTTHVAYNRPSAAGGHTPAVTVKGRTLSVSPLSSAHDMRVRVVDVKGQVRASFAASGPGAFSLSKVPAGRYFVEVAGAGGAGGGGKSVTPIVLK